MQTKKLKKFMYELYKKNSPCKITHQSKYDLLIADGWKEYSIIDSGNGRKLELFKNYVINRPEPYATWNKHFSNEVWESADAVFIEDDKRIGKWSLNSQTLKPWISSYAGVKFVGKISLSKNVGYFPEKQPIWDLISKYILSTKETNVLNLFGYTGVASLLAAQKGAKVTHVDSSKPSIHWAKENQKISFLETKAIRWICDDVLKFLNRELRRGAKYNLILLDPPRFGRGTKNEIWDIFCNLSFLLELCSQAIEKQNSLIILNTYSQNLSCQTLQKICSSIFTGKNCRISIGELAIVEQSLGRIIPQSTFSIIEYNST